MAELDPSIFQRYADHLQGRAGGIVTRWTIAGSVLFAVAGGVQLTSWANWPVPHRQAYLLVLLGALAGGILGRSLGARRATGLRLQAQLAEHQLAFERTALAARAATDPVPAQLVVPPAFPAVPAGAPPVSAPTPPAPAPIPAAMPVQLASLPIPMAVPTAASPPERVPAPAAPPPLPEPPPAPAVLAPEPLPVPLRAPAEAPSLQPPPFQPAPLHAAPAQPQTLPPAAYRSGPPSQ